MTKKIYFESYKKWLVGIGGSGTLILGLFIYLSFLGAIEITGYSDDMICAGTELDPCIAFINFTAKEDIFIYPMDYEPFGRDIIKFNDSLKDWKMYRSWGTGWREIKLDSTCTGTWCGAPNSYGVAYSFVFREDRDYQIKIVALKDNPGDTIKWSVDYEDKEYLDPTWEGLNEDNVFTKLISNKADLTSGEAIFEICSPLKIKLEDITFDFYSETNNDINYKYFMNYSETYFDEGEVRVLIEEKECDGGNYTYDCSTYDSVPYKDELTREGWKDSGEIIGCNKIKLIGKWKAELGDNSKDWVSTVKFKKEIIGTEKDFEIVGKKWAWWDVDWSSKTKINVLGGTTILNNFTVYIPINYSTGMNLNYSDIRFVNGTEDTILNYELDWSNSTHAGFWVFFPTLNVGNNLIYMYYGNDASPDISNATTAWNENYQEVFHFNNGSGSDWNVLDHSCYLAKTGTWNLVNEGIWNMGNTSIEIDGTGSANYGTFTGCPAVATTKNNITLEFFMAPINLSTQIDNVLNIIYELSAGWTLYFYQRGADTAYVSAIGLRSGTPVGPNVGSTGKDLAEYGSGNASMQSYIYTRNDTNQTFYLDGDIESRNITGTYSHFSEERLLMKYHNQPGGRAYMTEFRRYNGSVTDAWSNRQHQNLNSSYITFISTPQINITFPINNTKHDNLNLDINYTVSNSSGFLSACWYNNDTWDSPNKTLTDCGTNITTIVWTYGGHDVTVWANYTFGDENSSSVYFYILNTSEFNVTLRPGTLFEFYPINVTSKKVASYKQNSTNSVFIVHNNLSNNITIYTRLNETNPRIKLVMSNDSGYLNGTNITDNYYEIYTNLPAGNTTYFWAWADYWNYTSKWLPEMDIVGVQLVV